MGWSLKLKAGWAGAEGPASQRDSAVSSDTLSVFKWDDCPFIIELTF